MTKEERTEILKELKKHPILARAYVKLLKKHNVDEALTLIKKTFFKGDKYDK